MKTNIFKAIILTVLALSVLITFIVIIGNNNASDDVDLSATLYAVATRQQNVLETLEVALHTPVPPSLEIPNKSIGVWKYCYWRWHKQIGWIFGGTHQYTVNCYTEPLYGDPCAVRIEYLMGEGEHMMRLNLESQCNYPDPFYWIENVEE